jgi:hypothetical protein
MKSSDSNLTAFDGAAPFDKRIESTAQGMHGTDDSLSGSGEKR